MFYGSQNHDGRCKLRRRGAVSHAFRSVGVGLVQIWMSELQLMDFAYLYVSSSRSGPSRSVPSLAAWLKKFLRSLLHPVAHLSVMFLFFLFFSTLILAVDNPLCKSVLRTDLCHTTAQHGLLLGQVVHVFEEVSRKTEFRSTITLSDTGPSCETSLRRGPQN